MPLYVFIYSDLYFKRFQLYIYIYSSINRSYRAGKVRPEIQKINVIDRANLLIKKPKRQENSITFVLTQH